ncbi:transcriptional regulator family: Fungal Specific TF [Penicillium sp. IBT 18751x]|nr:transcriptional regulator family: Fungal Specific TF [Penicillium sp. IBT 18751x]
MASPRSDNSAKSRRPIEPISRGICARLSKWLWPSLWGCETARAPTPTYIDSPGCKACREWHVACDHAKPQCSHCYQQQLLCFYVNPDSPKLQHRLAAVPQLRAPSYSGLAETAGTG